MDPIDRSVATGGRERSLDSSELGTEAVRLFPAFKIPLNKMFST
jgi:hypothetical protein